MKKAMIFALLPLLASCSLLSKLESKPTAPGTVTTAMPADTGNSSAFSSNSSTATQGTSSNTDAAKCNTTAEQDAAAVRSAAQSAAQAQLAAARETYGALYTNISYEVQIGQAVINGNSASVSGSIRLSGTSRLTGQQQSGSVPGVVTLTREDCSWHVTGYNRTDL